MDPDSHLLFELFVHIILTYRVILTKI